MAAVIDYLDDLEIGVCLRVNQFGRAGWVRRFFAVVSHLGDGYFWAAMAVLVFALLGPRSLPTIGQIALTGAVGVVVYKFLKERLVRERPYIHDGGIEVGEKSLTPIAV